MPHSDRPEARDGFGPGSDKRWRAAQSVLVFVVRTRGEQTGVLGVSLWPKGLITLHRNSPSIISFVIAHALAGTLSALSGGAYTTSA